MKRLFALLLCGLLFTGCLPTPEVEIIPNKGEKKEWQVEAVPYVPQTEPEADLPGSADQEEPAKIEQQGGPLYEITGACPTWTMENNEYGFLITAQDCPIYLPDVSAVPVIEAEQRDFTQTDIDAVAAAMFPADTVWYPEVLWTKEELAKIIQETMEEAAKGDPNEKENGHNAKYFEDKLAMYKQRYDEAPFADEIVPTTLEINDCQDDIRLNSPGKKYPGVKAEARVNGEHWRISARTSANDPLTTYLEASRTDIWTDLQQPLEAPYGVKMTREEAIQKANEFARTVTGSNEYSVCFCAPIIAHPDHQENSGDIPSATLPDRYSQWGLVLMRTFNSCPSAFAVEEVGGDMDTTVSKPIHYERMELHIDDQGVSYFRWNTPMKVTGVISSNARLISFEEAAQKALSQIAARWKYTVENDRKNGKDTTVYITRITFGLWRTQKKGGGFYYVPVYHFFSEGDAVDWTDWVDDNPYSTEYLGISNTSTQRERFLRSLEKEEYYWMLENFCRTFGGEYWGGVTVNALDGTIIDKDKGY